MNSSGMHW